MEQSIYISGSVYLYYRNSLFIFQEQSIYISGTVYLCFRNSMYISGTVYLYFRNSLFIKFLEYLDSGVNTETIEDILTQIRKVCFNYLIVMFFKISVKKLFAEQI